MSNPINAAWRKSSHSGEHAECVELARMGQGVAVRDSKDPEGPVLRFSRSEMREALQRIRNV